MNHFIKVQIDNLVDGLARNITDNFRNVSFDILDNGYIQVKVILKERTEVDDEYINDVSAEFSAVQKEDNVNKFEVTTDENAVPRKYVVYNRIDL